MILNQYSLNEWLAMMNLKTSISYMKRNNNDGLYDSALQKQKAALRYFMTGSNYRKELPQEDAVEAA